MKNLHKNSIITLIVVILNLLLWIIPSKVSYLLAQQRDVLLGRYGMAKFTWMLLLITASGIFLYLLWSDEKNARKRQFKVITVVFSIILALVFTDLFLRVAGRKNYMKDSDVVKRVPNSKNSGVYKDILGDEFPNALSKPGYPDVNYTLSIDNRGFRNQSNYEQYDVITLGDSFTEGSNVSDNQAWPVLIADIIRQNVYNLGVSGGQPYSYCEILKRFGLSLKPKIVICMLYEGNDFRDENFENKKSISNRISLFFRASPVKRGIQQAILKLFAIKSAAVGLSSPQLPALSWMPIAVPDGNNGKNYYFKVKALLGHKTDAGSFLKREGTIKTLSYILEMKKLCSRQNIRYVLVYAPDKPHILMPLIKNKVTPRQLYDFMALKSKKLTSPEQLLASMTTSVEIRENEIKKFCQDNLIEFISLTEVLRQSTSQGIQAYYTFDQHWTPQGHEIAAQQIAYIINTIDNK